MMQIALIINPGAGTSMFAGQKSSAEEFEKALLQTLLSLGIEADIYHTTVEDPGEKLARQLASQSIPMVVAVGGDGTIHSVASGLVDSASVLGILPAGTMNNLAYSLGIPENLEDACAILKNGEARNIDVGSINQQAFFEVAGVGLEATIFPAVEEVKSRGILSSLRGLVSSLSTLLHFRPPHMSVAFENEKTRRYRAIQITICNSPYYGARLNLAPNIAMNDGWLDVVIYTNFSKLEYLRHALSISQGRRTLHPKAVFRRVKKVRISTSEVADYQADGIIRGHTPATIAIQPGALKVQLPLKPGPGLLTKEQEQAQNTMRKKGKHTHVSQKIS